MNKNIHFIIWAVITTAIYTWLTPTKKKELKLYRTLENKKIVDKYKIISECIGSLFIILFLLCIIAPLLQSGVNINTLIFSWSVYIFILITCFHLLIKLISKISTNYEYYYIMLVIAIRSHISYDRMIKSLYFIFIMSCSGIIYSSYFIFNQYLLK